MQFMMILKASADSEAGKPLDPRLIAPLAERGEQAKRAGILIASGALLPSSAGARIDVANGKVNVVDGPFAETKELVGGFAILEAKSRQEAIEGAKSYMQMFVDVLGPSYEGQMEVRQVMGPAHIVDSHGKEQAAASKK